MAQWWKGERKDRGQPRKRYQRPKQLITENVMARHGGGACVYFFSRPVAGEVAMAAAVCADRGLSQAGRQPDWMTDG